MRLRLPRGLWGRLLLLAGSSVVALLLVELGLRLFLPQQLIRYPDEIWTRDPELDWRFASNLDLQVNTGEGPVRLVTGERGYRVAPGPRKAAAGRILAVGDSFLAALQVESEETLTARLERSVSDAVGRRLEVVNTGTGGWNPNHYRLVARRELASGTYEALLVFLYAGNDLVDARYVPAELAAAAGPPVRPTLGQRVRLALYHANNWLERRSHAFKFFRDRGRFLRIRLGLSAHYFPFGLLTENAESPAWGITADLCREIADLAAEHGTPALFALLPTIYEVDRALSERYRRAFGIAPEALDLEQPLRLLRREFAARGIDLVDLTTEMRRVYREGGPRLYGEVDTHLSAEGHRVVARALERHVVELLGAD